jgi:hypothetical protein
VNGNETAEGENPSAGARNAQLIKKAMIELIADGCDEDEIVNALVQRFGRMRVFAYCMFEQFRLDEQAQREEWA